MMEALVKLNQMERAEFEIGLSALTAWILQIVRFGTQAEIAALASLILEIEDAEKFVSLAESLFVADQSLYVKLIRQGSEGIAKRRRELAG